MKPAVPLHRWPAGRYVNAANTDIRETFARVCPTWQRPRKPATVQTLKRKAGT